jgi:hypothetical protein
VHDRFWRFFHDWLARDGPYFDWLLQCLAAGLPIGRSCDDPEAGATGLSPATEAVPEPSSGGPIESAAERAPARRR